MPLSIGLFGEWGSGKSYFMELLRQQVDALSTGAALDAGAYLPDIIQVRFNAWHYADSNLWASLAAEFFDQLTHADIDPIHERRQEITEQLTHAQLEQENLKESATAATKRATDLRADLARASAERDRATRTFNRRLVHAVLTDVEIKKDLATLAEQLGVAGDTERVLQIAQDLQSVRDDIGATRRVALMRARQWPFVLLVATTLLLAAAALVPTDWAHNVLQSGAFASLAALIAGVGAAAANARKIVGQLRGLAQRAEDVEARIRTTAEPELAKLAARVQQAEASEQAARTAVDEAVSRVTELRRQLEQLQPGRRLYDFLAERAASTEYRSQLGVISLVRRDFEQLVALMDDWRRHPSTDPAQQPINRIVLYIDDLDRCEPDQVVTVLQAVHLLMAMDLFVVVVGVDPRWLLRSLRKRYQLILGADAVAIGDRALGFTESTPQDYLEKIFQIPFVLPEMGAAGFGDLLDHLAQPDAPATAVHPAPATARKSDNPAPSATASSTPPAQPAEPQSEVHTVISGARPATVTPITPSELALLKQLARLVRTPRAATRLFNIYGLVRSTRNLSQHGRFIGTSEQPGDYQAVVQLLGVLAAAPHLLGNLLWGTTNTPQSGLCRASPTGLWSEFVAGLEPHLAGSTWRNAVTTDLTAEEVAAWQTLVNSLTSIRAHITLNDITRYQFWGPKIARFSFILSPFNAHEQGQEPGGKPDEKPSA